MKTHQTLLLAAALTATTGLTHADTVLGVYAGVGIWQPDISGKLGEVPISASDLDIDDDNANFLYVALEHPVPLLPNIRLQQTSIDSSGNSAISSDFRLGDISFDSGEQVSTKLDLTHQDAVLYYEILDNWVNLDLGLNIRRYDGHMSVTSANESERVSLDGVIPMIYGKAQFDLPFTGWSVAGEANVISYSGDGITDYTVKIAYASDIIPLFDVGFEVGYRDMSLDLEDLDDLVADVSIDGPYAALTVHF